VEEVLQLAACPVSTCLVVVLLGQDHRARGWGAAARGRNIAVQMHDMRLGGTLPFDDDLGPVAQQALHCALQQVIEVERVDAV
jgi:hypothetical protein